MAGIRVVFFASIREALDCAALELSIDGEVSLSNLIAMLVAQHGESWQEALTAKNVRVAVNQELTQGNPGIRSGDEVAFLPPVSGG